MKHYTDENGVFVGTFEMPKDGTGNEPNHPDIPVNSIEVPVAPHDARQVWSGTAWELPLTAYKENRKSELSKEADDLIDTVTSMSTRVQMKMLMKSISMVDKQANRGQARNPMLDQLAAIAEYADAVEVEELNGHAAIDGAIDESAIDSAYDAGLAAMQAVPLPEA